MPNSNPESEGPSQEKISHGEKALNKEKERWSQTEAGKLLDSLEEDQQNDYAVAKAVGVELESSPPISADRRHEIVEGIKETAKKTAERQKVILQLVEMRHLDRLAAFHLSSIGDWMETSAQIGGVDFEYDESKPLLGQLDQLKSDLPPEVYKLLEAEAGKKWQEFEDICQEHNKIVADLQREGDILMAEKLEKLGFFDTETPQ
ncbi:hypothetical protein ACFL0Z_03285 [Patescibacteria group bacterium]